MNNTILSRTGKFEASAQRNGERNVFFDVSVKKNELGMDEFIRTATYVGEWKSDKKNGFGTEYIEGPVRTKYEGQFLNGKRDGRGTLWKEVPSAQNTKDFKLLYCGEWKEGQPFGYGTLYLSHKQNGKHASNQKEVEDVYEGEMNGYSRQGQGRLCYHNGDVYEGMFVADLPNGQGSMSYTTGNRYIGEWRSGQRNGRGRLVYANGSTYDGIWDLDCPVEGEYINDSSDGILMPILEIR